MDKRFWGIIAAIIIIFGGVYIATNHKNNSNKSSGQITHHVEGNTKSSVHLVEYGDYECPICGSYYPTVNQTVQTYKDKIQFQFINFPLTSIHQNAFAAARAAEAAGMQNKYWQMHDALYSNQNDWSSSSTPQALFTNYAKQIGLNTDTFQKDYASSQVNDAINADLGQANKLKLTGTPTFYLDGRQLDLNDLVSNGAPSASKFASILDKEIAAKQGSVNTSATAQSAAGTDGD